MSIRNKLLEEILSAINSGGGGGGTNFDQDKSYIIGQDFSDINEFLNAFPDGSANEYKLICGVPSSHIIDYEINHTGKRFRNVIIDTLLGQNINIATLGDAFVFNNCHPAPVVGGVYTTTQMLENARFFYAVDSTVGIAKVDLYGNAGKKATRVWHLDRCNTAVYSSAGEIHGCSDLVYYVNGGELSLNHMQVNDNCRIIETVNAPKITAYNDGVESVIDYTASSASASPLVRTDYGTDISNLFVNGSGETHAGVGLEFSGSNVNNVQLTFNQIGTALSSLKSTCREMHIDVSTFTGDSVIATDSDIDVVMSSASNGGGTLTASHSKVRSNKFDNINSSNFSDVYAATITNPPSLFAWDRDGVVGTNTSKSRSGESTVAAGSTYTPDLALNLEFINLQLIVNVRDVANDLMNSYDVKLINRPSGVEVVSITDIGTSEHSYADGANISATIGGGYVRLELPTTGSGEDLLIDYDLYYTR